MMKDISYISFILCASILYSSCGREIAYDACGQVDAVQVTVSAEGTGRVLSLDIDEGDLLSEGSLVGAIDTVMLHLQVQELRQRMEGAKSRLVDIKTQSAPDERQLESLRNDLKVYSSLLESNAATAKQVDDLRYKIAVLEGQIAARKQSWERSNESVRSEIATTEIQIAQRTDQISKCRITVPVAGTVLTKYVEAGESVTAGKPLFKIADLTDVYVRAYLTTAQLGTMKLGDTLTVIPDDGSRSPKEYTGTLTWISDQAEFTPKNIQTRDERADMVYAVKVSVPNDGSLRLGMYAYIRK
ncbi:MAG: HlyD family secretion protein [Candidatus Cryptobacteroides sp.]